MSPLAHTSSNTGTQKADCSRSGAMTCPHCGCEIETVIAQNTARKGKPRSVEQHRRYFAIINQAFMHWPESHEAQFASVEECRTWLQMKSGHREIAARIPITAMKPDKAKLLAEAAIRAAGAYAIPVVHGTDLVIWKPKSIAFNKLSHLAFCALNDAVSEVISAETGLDVEQLLAEKERAA